MAIDYGDARTGVAVSDPTGVLTGDAWVLSERDPAAAAQAIAEEARKREVGMLVVGYPKNMDGTAGERAQKSERFAQLLRERCNVEVKLWDERLTTVSALGILRQNGRRGKKSREKTDAIAASLILESYLRFA